MVVEKVLIDEENGKRFWWNVLSVVSLVAMDGQSFPLEVNSDGVSGKIARTTRCMMHDDVQLMQPRRCDDEDDDNEPRATMTMQLSQGSNMWL